MTLIDTADVYCLNDGDLGHNERLIASAIRNRPDRDRIRVATKAGMRRPGGNWTRDGSPKRIREACEKSLRALGVEQIWLYQFHTPDPSVPFEKSVEAFAELQRAGKCRYVGLSNVDVAQIERLGKVPVNAADQRYRRPLEEGARLIHAALPPSRMAAFESFAAARNHLSCVQPGRRRASRKKNP